MHFWDRHKTITGYYESLTSSICDKYDLTQHPNFKLTADYDMKNAFDIEKFLNHKAKLSKKDVFTVVDGDAQLGG